MQKKSWFIIMGATLVGILGFVGVRLGQAWVVQNPKWDISGSPVVTYRANQLPLAFQERLSDARAVWNNVSPAPIELYRNDISYGLRVYDTSIDGPGGIAGEANRYWSWNTYISWATIEIDQGENWYTGTGFPTASQVDLQSVLTHELGHILGIKHTNVACGVAAGPTMCPLLDIGTIHMRSLEADDQGALNYLYP